MRAPRRTGGVDRTTAPALAAVALLLAALGCHPPSLYPWLDPSNSRPVPRQYRTVAVLPFVGDKELRRPAEELVAFRLRQQAEVGVMRPLHVGRVLAAAAAAGELEEGWRAVLEGWMRSPGLEPVPADDRPARVRRLADVLGADALLVGFTFAGGGWKQTTFPARDVRAHLLLFDGASGEATALVARRATLAASRLGKGVATEDASTQAAEVMRRVLATRPGVTPIVRRPEPRPPPQPEPAWGPP